MTPGEVDQFVVWAAAWIRQQRDEHRPHAFPLKERDRQEGAPYFGAFDLDAAWVLSVPTIPGPPFLDVFAARLEAEGLPVVDFSQMAGITFIDTILVSRNVAASPKSADDLQAVLFHELVHVVQYRILGLEVFADQYVRGLAANGFKYEAIPLEVQAYSIGKRAKDGEQFPVEPVLRQMLARQ